jgi:hypothetical protein
VNLHEVYQSISPHSIKTMDELEFDKADAAQGNHVTMITGRNTPLSKSRNNLVYIRVALDSEPGGRFKVPAQLEVLAANEPHHAQRAANTVWRGHGPLDRSVPHRLYFVSCERSSRILAF